MTPAEQDSALHPLVEQRWAHVQTSWPTADWDDAKDYPSARANRPGHLREGVIGKAARSYMPRDHLASGLDTLFVLAIRAQREAGY